MLYVKPAILSTLAASSAVMGFIKSTQVEDNEGAMPANLSPGAAYQADE